MKKRILLPFVLLASFGMVTVLAGCDNKPKEEQKEQDVPEEGYGVEIANKDALHETWYAGSSRTVEINLTPEGNVALAINKKELTITSSNVEIASITGQQVNALAEGQATITVKYHGHVDSVDLTFAHKQTIREKYGVAHEGTAEDPLTNEDALAVAKHELYADSLEDLYVRGEIDTWYHDPIEQHKDGACFYLKPAETDGEQFEIYKCFKADGSKLADGDLWIGGIATVHGKFTLYKGQYETSAATFVSCTGTKPAARTTVQKTFADALAETKALKDGNNTYDYYQFDAYVTKNSGSDFYLTATKAEAISDTKANTIQLYKVTDTDAVAKLGKNAKVTVTLLLKNYHGQAETTLAVTADQITVVEAGGTWEVVPEPAVETRTLAQFIAGENTKAKAYNVTAEIKAFKNGATKDKYGNMTLTDGTNDLVIYGATMTATALKWNDSDAYAFTNPEDFMTNTTSNALAIGDTITMKMIRCDYGTTKEGQGIITNIEGGQGGGGGEQTAITTMQGIYESGKVGDAIDVKGVYVGAYGNKTNEWYVANGDYAVYLYKVAIPSGVSVGDSVRIQGKLGVYNGLIQVVADGATVTKITDTISYNTLSYTGGAFTKAQLSRPVQLTGTVKAAVAIDGSANKSVTLTVGTTDVTVYVKKSYGLDYTALNTAFGTANNTVTIKGYVAIYDGAATVDYATSTGYQVVSPSVVENAEPPALPGTID